MSTRWTAQVVPVVVAAATVAMLTACQSSTTPGLHAPTPSVTSSATPSSTSVHTGTPVGASAPSLPAAGCHEPTPSPGAPASLGLTVGGARAPRWSEATGPVQGVTAAGLILASPQGKCLVAFSPASGAPVWTAPVPHGLQFMAASAGGPIVLEALGVARGHAPANVYPTTTRIVGLDPSTGAQRWVFPLADDGQAVPAAVVGGQVVVTEAAGAVVGLDPLDGARRWLDPAPSRCASAAGGFPPAAALLPGIEEAIVSYQCDGLQELVRLDPATGSVVWTRAFAGDASVQYQSAAGETAGVIGVLISHPGTVAAPVESAPPGAGPNYESYTLLAIDVATGHPLWQAGGVDVASGVYGAAAHLCAVSGFGIGCYSARTGAMAWQHRLLVTPTAGGPGGPWFTGVAADAHGLYVTVPTAAARSIPVESTGYRSPPGAFELDVLDPGTGSLRAALPLPAFYGGSDGVVVSADSPPGVESVSSGLVLVCPQVGESGVVEAFAV